jgi:hypothetical protein
MKDWRNWLESLKRALSAVVSSRKRVLTAATVSLLTFYILVMSSYPVYSWQMITSTPLYWFIAFNALLLNMYKTVGIFSIGVTALYSVFTGIALVHALLQIRSRNLDKKNLLSMGPGIIATGCASCGAGLLGFLGFFGAISLLPMNGDLLKLGGITLLIFFLGRSGDPEICDFNPSSS